MNDYEKKKEQSENWKRIQKESQARYSEKQRAEIHNGFDKQSRPYERFGKIGNGKQHRRTEETNRAIRVSKDDFDSTCIFCGKKKSDGYTIEGMHLLCRDSGGRKRSDKTNPKQILPGCHWDHTSYDNQNSAEKKLRYLLDGIFNKGNKKLIPYAIQLAWILDMRIEKIEDIDLEEFRTYVRD